MGKSSFIMYTEYLEHINLLSLEQRGVLFTAVLHYASDREMPDMDGMVQMAFSFIKARMDRDSASYQKTVEARREAGRLGGLAKQANATFAKQDLANASKAKQIVANLADNDYVYDTDNDINKKESIEKKRFAPPTRQDVADYVREKGYASVDIDRFIDYYSSNGWMVGKNKMKDWRAAVRNWNRSQRQESTTKGSSNKFLNFDQREYDYDALEKQLLERSRS